MKLTTILRNGEARAALVIANPVGRCQCCLDLVATNANLKACGRDWGIKPIPSTLLKIIEGGVETMDDLKRIEERLLRHIDVRNTNLYQGTVPSNSNRPDRDVFDSAIVPPMEIYWLPPVPDVPLFITFHGNGIQLWRDRLGTLASRTPPRVPACRLHPVTSLLGHDEPMVFPRNFPTGYSNELGVVLAPGGRDIPYDRAHEHIWGVTNCNDATRSSLWPIHFGKKMSEMKIHEREARARLGRASDAASAFGPWITTVDEVPDVHDLLLQCWGPDGGYSRAHSSVYIMGPRNVVDYFSRFMTLPAGTILQFGAPGQDGVGGLDNVEPVHGKPCEMDMEHVGILSTPVLCEEKLESPRRDGEGFYGLATRMRGCDIASLGTTAEQPFPDGTQSIWGVRYNSCKDAEQQEYARENQRHYEIYPPKTLSSGEPVKLPQIRDAVEVSCELAAVVGSQPIARLEPGEVVGHLAGVTIMIGLRDHGLIAEVDSPDPREHRFGLILGRWYDGFNAIRPQLSAAADIDRLGDREMRLSIEPLGQAVTRVGDYLIGFGEAIAFMSKEITFLPGDVITLGSAGETLTIAADLTLAQGTTICASIEGLGEFTVPLIDGRASP